VTTTKSKKRRITGGVDTHKDTHHAAVVLMNGRRLADAEFPTTRGRPHRSTQMDALLRHAARRRRRGHRLLRRKPGPTPAHREGPGRRGPIAGPAATRSKGKSDPLDAYAAADAVLSGRATAVPKAGDGIVESIRAFASGPDWSSKSPYRLQQRDEKL